MKFMQIIEYKTAKFDEVTKLLDTWFAETEGKRALTQGISGRDRNEPDTYVDVVVFPSYEEAMKNNGLLKTTKMAQQMAALCEGVTFRDLDVVREDS